MLTFQGHYLIITAITIALIWAFIDYSILKNRYIYDHTTRVIMKLFEEFFKTI